MANSKLNKQNAVLLLENLFLRERLDLKAWDIRQMKKNISLMKSIVDNARWGKKEEVASAKLGRVIDELSAIVQNKDATLVDAAHTHLEEALIQLRQLVFGL
jgi:regulator of replication initiation timing